MKLERKLMIAALVAAILAIVFGGWHAAYSQEAEYNLRLTQSDVDVIGVGLGFVPFARAQKTVAKIQAQIDAQDVKAAQDAAKAKADAEAAKTKPKK